MSQKPTQVNCSTSISNRGSLEGGDHSLDDKQTQNTPSFRSVVLEAMRQKSFQNALEPMLRRVVKEEVDTAIKKYVTKLMRDSEEVPSELRDLHLKFLGTVSLPVFTGTRIEGEDGSPIKVALMDTGTNEVVLYNPESCARIEIVVLEGDFDGEERENWTPDEFRSNIVREREGKKSLLTGDVQVYLNEGIGSVGEISFTDNSSWTRSRRFRLGARVIGNYDGVRIREAKTESFVVRDHRGELYKKHYPPNLSDEVWRLEKIGKEGAFHKRLSIERVRTVKDFLILLHLDPTRLRNVLGSGMSAKMWDATVEHARTCVLDKRVYLYYSPMSQHKHGVVFNVVGQPIGLYSETQFVPVDQLPENDKVDLPRIIIEAFQHWEGVITFEDINSLISTTLQAESSPMTETSDSRNCLAASQTANSTDYAQPSTSSPDNLSALYSLSWLNSPDDFRLEGIDDMIFPSHSHQSFPNDEHLGFMDIDFPSIQSVNANLGSQADMQNTYGGSNSSGCAVRGPGHRRWRVLSSILRWFRIRRVVVTRRTPARPSALSF